MSEYFYIIFIDVEWILDFLYYSQHKKMTFSIY